jgi:hypothetical protein
VDPSTRVCPFCGEPPGEGVFCAACGRNLSGVERLPTAAQWSAPADAGQRVSEATDELLAALRAAGEPGAKEYQAGAPRPFRRTPAVRGWVVRPVDREDFEQPKRYEPGLLLSVDGRFHRLDSELRGWGQRDFPTYHHTVSPDPVEPPRDQRLLDELAALRAAVG